MQSALGRPAPPARLSSAPDASSLRRRSSRGQPRRWSSSGPVRVMSPAPTVSTTSPSLHAARERVGERRCASPRHAGAVPRAQRVGDQRATSRRQSAVSRAG